MQGLRSLSSRKLVVVDENGENANAVNRRNSMEDSSRGVNNKGTRPILRRFGSMRQQQENSSPDGMSSSERVGSGRPCLNRRFNNSRRNLMTSASEPDHEGRPGLTRRFSNSRRGLLQRQASVGSCRSVKSNRSVGGSAKIASLWDDHEGVEIGKKKEKPAPVPKSRPSIGKSLSFRKPKPPRTIQVVDDVNDNDDDDWSKELQEGDQKKETQGESFYMKIKKQAEEESLCAGEGGDTCRSEDDVEFLGMVIGVPTEQQVEDDLGLDDLPDLRKMAPENKRISALGMSMVLEGSREFENSMQGSKQLEASKSSFHHSSNYVAGDVTTDDDDDDSSAGETTRVGDGTTLGDDTTIGDDDGSSVGSEAEKEETYNKIRNLALLSRQSSFKSASRAMELTGHSHQAVEVPIMPNRRLIRD